MTQPNRDSMPAAQLALTVVGATKDCPACDGGIVFPCPHCKDGRIYVFPDEAGVRVKCPNPRCVKGVIQSSLTQTAYQHGRCHGLGYTATDRLEVLLVAIWPLRIHVDNWFDDGVSLEFDDEYTVEKHPERNWFQGSGSGLLETFYSALAKALVAQGCALGPTGKEGGSA